MKLEQDVTEPTTPAKVIGPSLDVEPKSVAVPFECGCGWEGQTSIPKKYTGKVRVECPSCGTVHNLRVAKEKK